MKNLIENIKTICIVTLYLILLSIPHFISLLFWFSKASREERREQRENERQRTESNKSLEEDIVTFLATLPPSLQNVLTECQIRPNQLFWAIDSLSFLISSDFEDLKPLPQDIQRVLFFDGTIKIGEKTIESSCVISEIASSAKISKEVAYIILQWAIKVLLEKPRLLSGIEVCGVKSNKISFKFRDQESKKIFE